MGPTCVFTTIDKYRSLLQPGSEATCTVIVLLVRSTGAPGRLISTSPFMVVPLVPLKREVAASAPEPQNVNVPDGFKFVNAVDPALITAPWTPLSKLNIVPQVPPPEPPSVAATLQLPAAPEV